MKKAGIAGFFCFSCASKLLGGVLRSFSVFLGGILGGFSGLSSASGFGSAFLGGVSSSGGGIGSTLGGVSGRFGSRSGRGLFSRGRGGSGSRLFLLAASGNGEGDQGGDEKRLLHVLFSLSMGG